MRRRRRPSAPLVISILALSVALGGGALAAIPDPTGEVHFCYSKRTGAVQVINANTDTVDCQKNWKNFNIDASPTDLVSPSGEFSVKVTDTSITLGGDGATIVLQKDGQIKLNSTSDVTVRATGSINLQATRVNQP
jgi:hypothetical protein